MLFRRAILFTVLLLTYAMILWFSAVFSALLLFPTMIGEQGFFTPFHWLNFIALTPLWVAWEKESSLKRIFWSGWLMQTVFSLLSFHWIFHTLQNFARLSSPLAAASTLLFAAFSNLQFPLAGLAWKCISPRSKDLIFFLGVASCTSVLQSTIPFLFEWSPGNTWHYLQLPGIFLAPFTGIVFLGTISYLINSFIALAITAKKRASILTFLGLALLIFLGTNYLGGLFQIPLVHTAEKINLLPVQANVGSRDQIRAEFGDNFKVEIVKRYLELTKSNLPAERPITVIWPETAFPEEFDPDHSPLSKTVMDFIVKEKIDLLMGGMRRDPNGDLSNAIFLISSNGQVQSYGKHTLLPFGEYLPLAKHFPNLKNLFPMIKNYSPGQEPPLLASKQGIFGVSICYEGIFPETASTSAKLGANLLINLTNDYWYGSWPEPRQHLYLSAARAIETQLPLMRVTNTGITAYIDSNGKIHELTNYNEKWAGALNIPTSSHLEPTFFVRHGEIINSLVLFLIIGLLIVAQFYRPKTFQ